MQSLDMNQAPRKTKNDAPVAQLVEHLTLNQGVQSSSLCGCTKNKRDKPKSLSLFCFKQIKQSCICPYSLRCYHTSEVPNGLLKP